MPETTLKFGKSGLKIDNESTINHKKASNVAINALPKIDETKFDDLNLIEDLENPTTNKGDKTPKKIKGPVKFAVDEFNDVEPTDHYSGVNAAGHSNDILNENQIQTFPSSNYPRSDFQNLISDNQDVIDELVGMGFKRNSVITALQVSNWSKDEAVEFLLNFDDSCANNHMIPENQYVGIGSDDIIGPRLPNSNNQVAVISTTEQLKNEGTQNNLSFPQLVSKNQQRQNENIPLNSEANPETEAFLIKITVRKNHKPNISTTDQLIIKDLIDSNIFHELKADLDDDHANVQELLSFVQENYPECYSLFVQNPELFRMVSLQSYPEIELKLIEDLPREDKENIELVK